MDDSWDVIVIGGGPAGCTAAAAAAREGSRTLLIEATGCLGGMGTSGLVPVFCPFSDKEKIIYRGLAEKVLNEMKKGMAHVDDKKLDWVPIDCELLKRIYDDMVVGSGAQVLFNTFLSAVDTDGQGNDKIGPGAPPVKTEKGWLTTFHAVDLDPSRGKNGWESAWKKRYCAGIMLLDLEDPSKVIGLCKDPLIAPETDYETVDGFRTNVIFPGGMILEDDGEVKIYYGAADTVECLATAHVDDLIKLCKPVG
ncbi:FAD-dependent oxidoreductase [Clostridium thermosuccinogenes]|uniref:FAD-dependent oxidoreductase n=1 Tax=Clostridium thermosuccinogenes TaxID=84032 RepID=UPI001930ED30|nr:FAD-dependent oxidoreductase [Pseudoclostridium thermosuccinogenes]